MSTVTEDVIERIGLRFEADGMSRIAGRMLGLLLLSPESLSLDDLGEQLSVSKTSASTNARLLERMGIVEPSTRPGDRRDYYRIASDLHTRLHGARCAKIQATKELLEQALETEAAQEPRVHERLREFTSFFDHMLKVTEAAGERWCLEHETERGARTSG